ncbi:DUF3305 domain-containing protein [Ramlibacter albus]|uniref:DUF3305 domain-containing protein n=1 Tax=Ramlibacter albus TaxID=2079448 RepID=A0A923M719_9BURK|nr:DUF3305 domain-containing protein [Ramlibacter albus]MBC5765432.1 DUF3305 domain-containing protein [Ramlibacter albus]
MVQRPSIEVAVVMRRVRQASPWQPWRWELADVVAQEPGFGSEPRLLLREGDDERWLYPGFTVELFRDEAEGYYLNATTPAPAWFVLWRLEDEKPKPEIVTLSYNEAARWLDAQETVEQVPAPAEVIEWMRTFAEEHYVPEPRRRKRPDSFKGLQDRFGNPVTITTEKK